MKQPTMWTRTELQYILSATLLVEIRLEVVCFTEL